jgi:hypothetical protein
MSTTGHVGPASGLWGSFGAALRLVVGWFSVAIAVLNLVAELGRAPERAYLVFHVVLLVGGLLLVSLDRGVAAAGPVGAGGAVLAGGMIISALPAGDAACCMAAFAVRHGYPFAFLGRNEGAGWQVDAPHLVADLLFWGYAGLVVLALVALTRRFTQRRDRGTG